MKKVIAVILCVVMLGGCSLFGSNKVAVELYFANADGSTLVTEARTIKRERQDEELIKSAVEALIKGPQLPENRKVIPEGTRIISVEKRDTVAVIDFTKEFSQSTGVNEILSRLSVVNTVCGLPVGITKVLFKVEGEEIVSSTTGKPVGALGKDDIILDAQSNKAEKAVVTLYFSDKDAMYLEPEQHELDVKPTDSLEKIVMSELIKGPKSKNLHKTVPAETKLLSIETKDGVCFVNLSRDFVDKHSGGSTGAIMTIYSIVNSLTELPGVQSVQFLIEGQKVETFKDLIFNEPFVRNNSLIKK